MLPEPMTDVSRTLLNRLAKKTNRNAAPSSLGAFSPKSCFPPDPREDGVRSVCVHSLPPDVFVGPGSMQLTETSGMPKSRTFLSKPYNAA